MAVHFFAKKLTTFLVVVTFKRTLNVQTSKQRDKNLAAYRRGPLATGAPSHDTTGTMDNPALLKVEKLQRIERNHRPSLISY